MWGRCTCKGGGWRGARGSGKRLPCTGLVEGALSGGYPHSLVSAKAMLLVVLLPLVLLHPPMLGVSAASRKKAAKAPSSLSASRCDAGSPAGCQLASLPASLPSPAPPALYSPPKPREPKAPRLPPTPRPSPPRPPQPPSGNRPNFVVIVTDDQDEVLNSTHPVYMPALNSLVGSRGIRFTNTLVSTSVCCPARVSLLTGRLAHCTNVTSNWAPMGAWGKFARLRLDSDWLPGWLQEAGYRTGLVGKLLNGFAVPLGPQARCPIGLDVLDALTLGTYDFYNSSFSLNCGPDRNYAGQYQTDIIRDKALSYLDNAVVAGAPFYLQLTPAAPHTDNGGPSGWRPPPPALRHADLYPHVQLPANPTLLKPNPLDPSRKVNMSSPDTLREMTELYAGRLRALRAVDEMLGAIVSKLSDLGILNNTYIIYMSDNGLHMGQHALEDGKATSLEEDSRVPLYLSGPGVAPGKVSSYQANLVDLAPTVLHLAGLPPRPNLDGLPLPMEGLTMEAYGRAMQNAVTMVAQRAGLMPPSPPPSPSQSPAPQSPAPPLLLPPSLGKWNGSGGKRPALQAQQKASPLITAPGPVLPQGGPLYPNMLLQGPPPPPQPPPLQPSMQRPPPSLQSVLLPPLPQQQQQQPSLQGLGQPPPLPPLPPPPPPEPIFFREGLILEAWDSDAKSGFFSGITFKALRLCSTYQHNLMPPAAVETANTTASAVVARPPPPSAAGKRSPPPTTAIKTAAPLPAPPLPLPVAQPPLQQLTGTTRLPALMVPQPPEGPPVFCLKYVVWCRSNQRELYDLSGDPFETTSVVNSAPTTLLARLDAVMSVLVHCRGLDCVHPYGALHPAGDVRSFTQAMHPRYDALYGTLPRFRFVTCYPGYVPANERTFTLGLRGFPSNASWESTGIVWPLPSGARGIRMEPSGE